MLTFLRKGFVLPLFLFFFTLTIYVSHLSPSVYGGDVGDLVSAIAVRGVAHPPGYPLFTLLGIAVSFLPFSATLAHKVGLISAISSALTVVLLFFIIKRLGGNNVLALLTSLTFAFFYQFWLYAEVAEVFALNTFFAASLFYLWLSFAETQKKIFFYAGCLVLGLSLSHHHTIILVFPGLLALCIKGLISLQSRVHRGRSNPDGRSGKTPQSQKRLPRSIHSLAMTESIYKMLALGTVLFFVGLLPYLYIPITASKNPAINWDDASTLPNFIRLVLRQDYGSFSAGPFAQPNIAQRFIELKGYFISLFTGFTVAGALLIILGVIYFFKKKRFYFFVLMITFLLSGPIFIFYAGFPIKSTFILGIYERFFILSAFFLVMLFPFGVQTLLDTLVNLVQNKDLKKLVRFSVVLFFIIPFSLFQFNNLKTNLSSIWIGDDLGYDYLAYNPPHSIVLLSGDTELFNAQYMYYARKLRNDEIIINMNNIATSDFFNAEYKKVLSKNKLYEEGDSDGVIDTLIEIAKQRPVLSMGELQYIDKKKEKLTWVPKGLLKELYVHKSPPTKEKYSKEIESIQNKLHVPRITKENALKLGNLTIADIKRNYANAALAIGTFYMSQYKETVLGEEWYHRAVAIDPTYNSSYKVIGSYYFEEKKDCKKAAEYFNASINVDKSDRLSYFLLYNVFKSCLKDDRQAENVAKSFKENFGREFLSEIQRVINDYESFNK